MTKFLSYAALIAAGAVGVYFLTPPTTREKALALLYKITPVSVEEKIQNVVDPIIHTPQEQRKKLISRLKTGLSEIRAAVSGNADQPETRDKIFRTLEESQKLAEKIETINGDSNTISKITASVVENAGDLLGTPARNKETSGTNGPTIGTSCP